MSKLITTKYLAKIRQFRDFIIELEGNFFLATYWGKQVNQPIFEYETNIFLSYCWWVSELSRFYAIYCKWASYKKLEVTMEYSSMHGWWYFINLSFINYHTAMEIIIFSSFYSILFFWFMIIQYPVIHISTVWSKEEK